MFRAFFENVARELDKAVEQEQQPQRNEQQQPDRQAPSNEPEPLDLTDDVQFIPLPSVESLRNMRNVRLLQRAYLSKQHFAHRTHDFVNALRSSLVNQSMCEVRRRVGFDNVVSYRIVYRPKRGSLPPITVRISESDWKIIAHQLRRDGHDIVTSRLGDLITIKLN